MATSRRVGVSTAGAGRTGRVKEDRHFVTSLARGLEILHAFRSGEERLSNQELAHRCALPRSTVTRLTYTLTKLGHLHHVPETGQYRLGLATLALGGTTLSRLDVKEVSNPLLQELADATGTMVSLLIRDDMSMLYIENCRAASAIVTLQLGIGSRIPMASTAGGRGYLAGVSEDIRQRLLERLQLLDPRAWPAIERGVRRAVSDLRQFGCVTSFGDWKKEVNGIAVPVQIGAGLPLLVVSAAGSSLLFSPQVLMQAVRPRMLEAVRQIEARHRAAI